MKAQVLPENIGMEMNDKLIKQLSELTQEERKLLEGKGKSRYIEGNYPDLDRKAMLVEGELMQICRHCRFVHYSRNKRNYIEGMYVCRGQQLHCIEHQTVILKQGELLLVSPDADQEILPAGDQDVALHFLFLPDFFELIFSMLGDGENLLRNYMLDYLKNGREGNKYIHCKVADVLPVQHILENMAWSLVNPQPNTYILNQTGMGLLFMTLVNYTDKMDLGPETFEPNLLMDVLRYIEEHYRDGRLNELCHLLGYDIYWLSRAIKKMTGKNYKELLQIKRLNLAAHLLLNTRATISDISIEVGYDNTSYFHRLFREYFGISPKEYRREKKIRV